MKKDVIVIGAGAAGLMCAIEAGKRGRSVLVLDHAGSIGQKIRVSEVAAAILPISIWPPRNTCPAIRTSVNQLLPVLVL